jgi:hypothetical protein
MSQNQGENVDVSLNDNPDLGLAGTVALGTTIVAGAALGLSEAFAPSDGGNLKGLAVTATILGVGLAAAGVIAILDAYDVFALGELKFGMIQDNLSNYNFTEIFNNNPILKKYIVTLPFVISKINVKDVNGNIVNNKMICYYYDKYNNQTVFIDKIQAPNGKVIYELKDNSSDDLNIDAETLLMRIVNNSNINNNKFTITNNGFENTDSKSFNVNINIKHSGYNLLFNKPAVKGTKGHTGGKHSMLGNRRR